MPLCIACLCHDATWPKTLRHVWHQLNVLYINAGIYCTIFNTCNGIIQRHDIKTNHVTFHEQTPISFRLVADHAVEDGEGSFYKLALSSAHQVLPR